MVQEMKSKSQPLLCSLSFDEMAIRKHHQYCDKTKKFLGTITHGENFDDVANNAIVFLVNSLNSHAQIPIAYYFITTITSEQRKTLLLDILSELFEREVIISNVTFDGLAANAKMCRLLGAVLDTDDLQPYFIEPNIGLKAYIILDPSHCEKLVRNILASREILWDSDGGEIKWQYFRKLVEFGKKTDYNLTHKMNKLHIDFQKRKMHVRTLSSSVANSMQWLMENDFEDFAGASATIKFIRKMDSLFDVMNTQRIINEHPNQLKSALNQNNSMLVLTFLMEAKEYLCGLMVRSSPVDDQMLRLVFVDTL